MKVAHKSPFLAVLQEGNFSCEQSHTISLPCPLGDEQNVNLCIQIWHMSPILFENCWVHYACHCVLLLYHRGGLKSTLSLIPPESWPVTSVGGLQQNEKFIALFYSFRVSFLVSSQLKHTFVRPPNQNCKRYGMPVTRTVIFLWTGPRAFLNGEHRHMPMPFPLLVI